jgi:tetratricopeptide (TPR) repeat protein
VALGHILARLGRRNEAVAAGQRAVELYPTSLDAFHGPYFEIELARIYGEVGDFDEGFEWLESVFRGPVKSVVSIPFMRLDPRLDAVRNHPRYLELEAEFGSD